VTAQKERWGGKEEGTLRKPETGGKERAGGGRKVGEKESDSKVKNTQCGLQ